MMFDQVVALAAAGESETLEFKHTTGSAARPSRRYAPCATNVAGMCCSASLQREM